MQTQSTSDLKFKMSKFDSGIANVLWCGARHVITDDDETIKMENFNAKRVLFLLTENGLVYRSLDHGFVWENSTKTLENKFGNNFKQSVCFLI